MSGGASANWRNHDVYRYEKSANVLSHYLRAARLYLSMPAGGSPSEVAFSSTTEMVTKKRNALSDCTLELMTVIRHFVRQPNFDFDKLARRCKHTH